MSEAAGASSLRDFYIKQLDAREHGEHWSGPPEMVDELVRIAKPGRGDRILDLGAGVGGPGRRLAALSGSSVVSLDLFHELLRNARARGAQPTLVAADACQLPFASATFDQVWALGVVAHIADLRRFAGEVARVVVPGGLLLVTEAFWDGERRPRFEQAAPSPWRPLTTAALGDHLESARFDWEIRDWPGHAHARLQDVEHPGLRSDLVAGRLRPALVVARRT